MPRIKLIAFDLDGVLVDGHGSWQEVHKGLGTEEKAKIHSEEYHSGKITFDEWAVKDTSLWHGVEIERIKEILYNVHLMPGISDTIPKLREKYKVAIISGGLNILAEKIKEDYSLDHAVANELLVENNKVCGIRQVVDFQGKGRILEEIADINGISTKECAVIGDFINDIPMFRVAGFRIAFNPKNEEILKFADVVIYEKDLRRILEFF